MCILFTELHSLWCRGPIEPHIYSDDFVAHDLQCTNGRYFHQNKDQEVYMTPAGVTANK